MMKKTPAAAIAALGLGVVLAAAACSSGGSSNGGNSSSSTGPVTLTFWTIKILATTLGETGGDTVTMTLNWGYLAGTAFFLAALVLLVILQIVAIVLIGELRVTGYVPDQHLIVSQQHRHQSRVVQ